MQKEVIEGYRLSPQQKHLWSLQQLDPTLPYRTQFTLLIEGNLNLYVLEEAWQNVVNRHEILRTTFQYLPGMTIPLQVINETNLRSVDYHDLSNLDDREQNVIIEELFDQGLQLLWDFEKDSLLYLSLLTLSPDKYVLIIGLPALCADLATLKNLVREIGDSYSECLAGELIANEPLQYADIAEWQNEILETDRTKAGVEYWCDRDFSAAFNLKLPLENKLAITSKFEPQFLSLIIHQDLVAKLEDLAQKYNVSIDVFLLACWQIMLWRLSGQPTIIVGQGFDGRKYEELEQALGLFGKYLPLSCHFKGECGFSEILEQVDKVTKELYKWQEYFDWEKALNLTEDSRDLAFLPFIFEFSKQPETYCKNGVFFSVVKQYVCCDRFKIKLSGIRRDDSLVLEFHYDSALFDAAAIHNLASQFQTLLASALAHPEAAIGKLEILKPSDRQQLLVEFNQTQADYPQDKCIHQLFEQQVARTPDRIAVVFEDQQLTYAELNARANKLAHYLQRLGVGSEVIVGLCVERSSSGATSLTLDLIVGLLGILKAGGAYLPLDPALPQEGLAFRLQDAGVSLVVSHSSLLSDKEFLSEGQRTVICLDTDWETIEGECDWARRSRNPSSKVKPENLVYVIYTSGSTGKPKGVAVEHQQLLNYTNAILERLDLFTCTSFATVSTFAADLGNTVIFPSLCSGGCLHIVSSERASNPEALADYFEHHPIDCLKIVPSHLAALLNSSRPESILPRQRLILGGEACHWTLIQQVRQLGAKCQIFNHYGPTETTVGVLTYAIEQERSEYGGETVPIGRAIANTQIYLLDSYLQPVPIGVSGELYVGGAGVARGYLNQPELTHETFIPNPLAQTPGQRLYKTGDLARYLSDGNIEFLGRVDCQVKIHGFRIELGEIEAALRQHPAVRETAVLAREERESSKRLVAYVVPEKQSTLTTKELRQFLQEKLSEYMIPSAFVRLKVLPLTPNGKVDRQALPAPNLTHCEWDEPFVAPRTSVEKVLAGIWTQVLRLEKVGIYNNFFELGGDSILSMQIVGRANRAGLQLTPKQLFEYPTIAELAAVASSSRTIQAEQGLVTGEVPLTPIQHWFFEQNLPQMHHWNQSVLLEMRQAIVPELLEQGVQKLLEHHDALRLHFVRQESGWQQVNANPDGVIPFACVDLSAVPETEQESTLSAIATDLQTTLNLSSGRVVRIALFDLGTSQRLLLVIHHLVVDGVSWRILLEDLQTAYQQLSQGQAIQLPPKTTSFQHWAERLTEYAQSEALQQELDYWLTQSRRQIAPLPVDFPGDNNTVAHCNTISATLSQEETQALLQEVPAAYQTQINDVLLTALVQAVKQWTGESLLLVDLEGHGREEIFADVDLSRTVGWFTTLFPVLLDIGEASSPGDALKTIKEQLRNVPNRGIGYGVLHYLSLRNSSMETKAQIRFNYLGQSDQVLSESSLFASAQESSGSGRSLQGSRVYLLDINGIVAGGQLRLDWTYSEAIHCRDTIENLAGRFIEALRSLIAHCQSKEAEGYTPSDFPQMQLSQHELDELLAEL
ncbi:MAG TPA: non-ribosomal peptide synthetase [Cyanobacteria bacterium UBA8803]|nr:non-ribosomal peptide synthetase [Cyanobacteria bacterium UBA9273]HBL59458.1 non-ribosomal peptide synthetase [Cyanobacteria bacterium UBA8803]